MLKRPQLNFHHIPHQLSDEELSDSSIGPAPVPQPRAGKHTPLNHTGNIRSSY